MGEQLGACRWAVSEGYIPEWSQGPEPQMTSHETLCLLNANASPAHVTITIYFSDREPSGPYHFTVEAKRTKHIRLNDLRDPAIPRGVDFASVVESDVPVVVQHTRLDSRQPANALLSTIAFSG
jgi:hypothetical protein